MLAHVVAVVAVEDDDRLVGELQPVEGVEQLADLLVHERDRGEIGLAGLARSASRPCRGGATAGRRAGCRQVARPSARPAAACSRRIHLEVLLRRDVGRVRAIEAAGDEERLVVRLGCSSSSLIVISAPMPSVCSLSSPSAASQLGVPPNACAGREAEDLASSSLSRPRGLNLAIQDGGSSRPSVPICAGTP